MTFAATGLSAAEIAAIEAAAAQAAAASATAAGGGAIAAETAIPALTEMVAPAAVDAAIPEIATSAADSIASQAVGDAGISDTMSGIADQTANNIGADAINPSMQSVNQPVADPSYAAENAVTKMSPDSPMSAENYVDAGQMGAGQPSIADQMAYQANNVGNKMSEWGGKAMDALTDPKTLAGAGVNLGGTLMQQGALDAEQAKKAKEHEANMRLIGEESDKLNGAIGAWGRDYLSPEGMASTQAESEAALNDTLGKMLASANKDSTAPNGAMSSDFTKAMADGSANAANNSSTYAKLMAKAQAPAFANINSQIGALRANNDAMSAQSRINGIGAIDRASQQNLNPNTGAMIGGSVLQGLGSAVGKTK